MQEPRDVSYTHSSCKATTTCTIRTRSSIAVGHTADAEFGFGWVLTMVGQAQALLHAYDQM